MSRVKSECSFEIIYIFSNYQIRITKSILTIEKKQVEQYFGQEDYWCTCVLRNSDNASEKSKRAYIRIACELLTLK